MLKQMSYKKIIICVCAAAAVIAVALVVLLSKKEEAFRSIMVYDVEGSAVIERETVGSMDAAENLYLESGDRVSVASDSSMRMKLDDDKYVMAEADTIFSVEAEGTDADSKTKISLEQGAITNEIQHPLSEGSQYETSTPNSVMAVRGTIYRVELYVDENGDQNTKLCCFQGKVGTKPILPDGTYGEEIMVPAGSEVTVYKDGTVDEVKDIVYEELPGQAIENLISMAEDGQSMTGISLEKLTQLASEKVDVSKASESEAGQSEQAQQSETMEAAAKNDAEKETDAQVQAKADTAQNVPAQPVKEDRKPIAPKPPAEQPVPQPQVLPNTLPTPSKAAEPVNSSNVENDNTAGGDSQEDNNGNDSADDESNDDSDDDSSDNDKPDKDKPDHDKPSKPVSYTVTFMYQGKTFATQTVLGGERVLAPMLMPAQNGAWNFDFGTEIEADTTISWE